MWWKRKKKTTRTELEEDAGEDLELKQDEADEVGGGASDIFAKLGDIKGESIDRW